MTRARTAGAGAWLAALALACAAPQPHLPGPSPRLSFLALGDTGTSESRLLPGRGQETVARALAAEDRRLPVDAVVFLGDNFYPQGLQMRELEDRVRRDLVAPYCHFAALEGPRSHAVRSACPIAPAARHPVPMLAVLGNHDHKSPESARLQRRRVPDYVSNWHVPEGAAEVIELGPGLSLVLADSAALVARRDPDLLAAALRRARGPLRVLVSHHPLGGTGETGNRYRELVRAALRESGSRVQLHLAGHAHNLQARAPGAPGPALEVIAGSGARAEPVERDGEASALYGSRRLGFARVDVLGAGDGAHLGVTLFAVPRWPWPWRGRAEPVARYVVEAGGAVRPLRAASSAAGALAEASEVPKHRREPRRARLEHRTVVGHRLVAP